jgi:hypothetical protein
LRRFFRYIKPGGYFEIAEIAVDVWSDDGGLTDIPCYVEFLEQLREASKETDRPLDVCCGLKQWALGDGFENVEEKMDHVPLGPWLEDRKLRKLGRCMQTCVKEAIRLEPIQSVCSTRYYVAIAHTDGRQVHREKRQSPDPATCT